MDIKELATLTAAEMDDIYLRNVPAIILEQYATRLIAAYTEGQEPVAWVPQFSWQRSIDAVACISKRSFDDIPLFAAPVKDSLTTEPEPSEFSAEQRDKDWSAIKSTAPSSEEVREILVRLNAVGNTSLEYAAADALEALGQQVAALVAERAKSAEQYVARLNQIDALTKELENMTGANMLNANALRLIKEKLAAAQAREANLREALTAIRGGHCISTFLCADEALALPIDDSALMERLKQERLEGYNEGYADAERSMT